MIDPKRMTLVGHGWHFIPRVPFELGRLASGDVVMVHHSPPSVPKLRLQAHDGGLRFALGPGTQSAEQVVHDYVDGQALEGPDWSLGFEAGYLMPWPFGTSVWSTKGHVDWPVELTLSGSQQDEMLYVQGPLERQRSVVLSGLIGPGMELASAAEFNGTSGRIESLELRYQVGDREWRQWRCLVPLGDDFTLLLTAQATLENQERMRAIVEFVATGIR